MTQTERPASGQEAGRGNEHAKNGSHPNTVGFRTQVYRDPNKVILRIRRTRNDLVIVDLECEEAQFFALRFLPTPTHRIIRSDKKSRWVYRVRS
ncbi:hypothetical protein J2R76_005807 [Bradyrhizobium sp. USDA 4532]|nr:hypothetical protein [Bradyrhizobium sp. USDA 4545]MCP1922216.1 hypothetical protein [Bradyrhizobium sp. USDA 4532]